jgi:UDP-GlcNAc:undecaprenyl-phosphate GlcNAc-1-phosphate transferase
MMNPYIVGFTATVLSFFLTIPTMWIARKYKFVTDSRTRAHPAHTHRGIIPRAGGIPIYLSFLLCILLFVQINKIILGILIASALLIIVGLIDDFHDSSPYLRFISNIVISALVISFGLGIPFISNPFGGVIRLDTIRWTIDFLGTHSLIVIGDLLAIIWLTWTTNMINWSKGVDGQLPGFVAITAFFLGLLSQRFTGHDVQAQTVMTISFIIAGAYLGFLPFNFYPQKIMPGYSGGALAGFWLGILSIISFGKIGTAILILAVPFIDGMYSVVRRIAAKHSPFRADWGHFHHLLLDIGWGRRRIAVFYWLISFLLGVASLMLEGIEKLIAFVTIGFILISFIFIIQKIKKDA